MREKIANPFTHGSLAQIYVKTALPIIFVMCVSGLVSVFDAMFLGYYIGTDALAAVTLMFPAHMFMVALSTLVSNGMSSVASRSLGANDITLAREAFIGAHGLAMVVSCCLIPIFMAFGKPMAMLSAGQNEELAEMGFEYLRVIVLFSPLAFLLSVNLDGLRSEGRVAFMVALTFLVSIANIIFNYLLIVIFDAGVIGAAYGTVLAQGIALLVVVKYRLSGKTQLGYSPILHHPPFEHWKNIILLGAPQSLGFIGQALGSVAVISALQWMEISNYSKTVSAYGVSIRILTFAYLPLLGLSFSMQTISGNNFGAGLWHRSNSSLKIAIAVAAMYCGAIQITLTEFSGEIAELFLVDAAAISEFSRIIPVMTLMYVFVGPHMILAAYFQAVGSARKAAILSLAKPFIFIVPMVLILPFWFGENVIWLALPLAELMLLVVTIWVLLLGSKDKNWKWGVFRSDAQPN